MAALARSWVGRTGAWVAAVGVSLAACGSSEPSGDGIVDPGHEGGGGAAGGTTTGQPDRPGGGAPACTAPGAPALVLGGVRPTFLTVSGSDLVFINDVDERPTPQSLRQIRRIGRDGTGDVVLFSSRFEEFIANLTADETNVYFIQESSILVGGDHVSYLYRMPKAGGTPQRVSPASTGYVPDAVVFAQQAGFVFVNDTGRIFRVSLADGSETLLTKADGPRHLQLLGNVLYFMGFDGMTRLLKLPVDVPMPSAVRVGDVVGCGTFALVVTPAGIFCDIPGGVVRYDLDGTNRTLAVNGLDPEIDIATILPSLPDGDAVYLYGHTSEDGPTGALRRMSITGGPAVPIACGRDYITDVRFGSSDIYWLETRDISSFSRTFGIYRLAK
jgi:hypothetical protein